MGCPAVKKQPGGPHGSAAGGGVKRPQRLGSCLPSRKQSEAGRLSSNPDSFRQKKAPTFRLRLVLALPIFPASHPASIVGEGVLNFCVRDGNRWTHTPINTNSYVEEVFPFLSSRSLLRISDIRRTSASGLYQISIDLSTTNLGIW